jgi:hypothetical protein
MTADEVMALIRAGDKPHYVYVLRRPSGEPFYVGIGTGMRIMDHAWRAKNARGRCYKSAIIRKIIRRGEAIWYDIVGWFDRWSDAAEEERRLIVHYGRSDRGAGPLTNLTDGGDGTHGHIRSAETRAKLGRAHAGKIVSPETRELLRQASLGKRQTAEVVAKRIAKQFGRSVSEETRRKIGEASKRVAAARPPRPPKMKPPRDPKPPRPRGPRPLEVRLKIAEAQRGRPKAETSRAAMSLAQRARFERHRAEGGLILLHHKGRTPEGRAKHRRPVEIGGIRYEGSDCAAATLGVGRTTIKRWLASGHNGARRISA